MVGVKLNSYLNFYLGVPYWRNQVDQDGTIKKEGPFAGKGSPVEIEYANKCSAFQEKLKLSELTTDELHNLQRKYQIGIDCGGLVYNLLEAHAQDNGFPGIYYYITGMWRGVKRNGIRSVYATNFADSENSQKISEIQNAQTGDLICLLGKDGTGHVIFILDNQENILNCVHSSSETNSKQVHKFQIHLSNPKDNIAKQEWELTDSNGNHFLDLFDLENEITGVYRPLFLCH